MLPTIFFMPPVEVVICSFKKLTLSPFLSFSYIYKYLTIYCAHLVWRRHYTAIYTNTVQMFSYCYISVYSFSIHSIKSETTTFHNS